MPYCDSSATMVHSVLDIYDVPRTVPKVDRRPVVAVYHIDQVNLHTDFPAVAVDLCDRHPGRVFKSSAVD